VQIKCSRRGSFYRAEEAGRIKGGDWWWVITLLVFNIEVKGGGELTGDRLKRGNGGDMSGASVQLLRVNRGWHTAAAHRERWRRYQVSKEEERPPGGLVMGQEAELLGLQGNFHGKIQVRLTRLLGRIEEFNRKASRIIF
jgi:hypothetical protein